MRGTSGWQATESDCRFLEKPPPVPPVKPYQVIYRPGRPKKGATPPTQIDRGHTVGEELPPGLPLPDVRKHEDV